MAEQTFTIKIPIQTIDMTDKSALDSLDEALSRVLKQVKELKSASSKATEGLADGAKSAAGGLKDAGKAAEEAGQKADAFEKRLQKTQNSLQSMFKQKFQIVMEAMDKASPILKKITSSAKSLVGKAWRVTVTLLDKVTAPFRGLYRMITNPISIALSIAGLGLGVRDTVKGWIDFEKGMSAVRALTGATNEEFKRLNQTAKDLGASTVFSASEVSLGMQYLGQAGWQVNEIIAAMPGLLDMAAAGGADLAVASDIVATVMRAMKIEAKDASMVADIFAKTATSSATDIQQMGETLKYAAPIAQGFGLTLAEVAALTGQMADSGIKGSMAGTAIRSSLLSMATPTKAAAKLMDELNLSFSNADGSMKNMGTIIRELETSFSGLTREQRLNAAETLFGTYASSAWLGVIEQGADSYEAFQQSLEGSAGAAGEMAKIRLDNLAGDIEELSGAFETLQLELMEKLNPYLRQFVQWFTDKVPAIQERLLAFADKAIAKIKEVSQHISEVFQSDDFKAADGFAEKFFVAWDKIIAEPLMKWWNSGGKDKILSVVERMATAAGEMLRGIATGIISAFTGQEVDFEALNLTGMAKTGAETAKTFVSSFFKGLDTGGIAAQIPSIIGTIMKDAAGLLMGNQSGTGLISAFLVGKGLFGVGKTAIGGLRAYYSLSDIFTKMQGKLAAVGTAAAKAAPATQAVATAASAAGASKSVGVFASIKGALAAIPGWGWAAAGALLAVGMALKLHNDAQERHRQELMTNSEEGARAWEQYKTSAQEAIDTANTIDRINEIKLNIARGGLSDSDIANIRTLLSDLNKDGAVEIEIIPKLKQYGLSDSDISGLRENLKNTEGMTSEIETKLKKGTNWTQEEIDKYITDLTGAEGRKIQIDLLIQGASLEEGVLKQVEADLAEVKVKIKSVDTSTLEGLAEWQALKEKEVMLTLLLQGGNLTPEQVTKLAQEYALIETKTAILTAELKKQGFTDKEVQEIVTLSQMAGQNDLIFNVAIQGISADQLAAYNQELETLYGHLVGPSGGIITAEDAASGNVTDQQLQMAQQYIDTKAETDLINLRRTVESNRATIGDQLNKLNQYGAAHASAEANMENTRKVLTTAKLMQADLGRQESSYQLDLERYRRGEITKSQYMASMKSYQVGIQSLQAQYEANVLPHAQYASPSIFEGLDKAVAYLNQTMDNIQASADASKADYDKQYANLVGQYTNEKKLMAGETFSGTGLAGKTIEDVAAAFNSLDAAGTQLFVDALNKLGQLNAQSTYVSTADKTTPQDMTRIAEASVLVADAKQRISSIQVATPLGSSEEDLKAQADAVAQINTVLESMNLEKISGFDQIGEALKAIEGVDLSKVDTSALEGALAALGGVSEGARAKIDALRSAVARLDGSSATVTVTTNYKSTGTPPPKGELPAFNATGGIYSSGAFLSWVAEDGPEAIIPLGAKRRQRGISLWKAAGRALGIGEFADGGIMAPYSGLIGSMDDDNERPAFMQAPTTVIGGPIQVTVSANPTYQINDASNPQAVIDAIKQHQHELSEMLAVLFAEQIEEAGSNMPA